MRVHREFLQKQKLPPELVTKDIWEERFQDIRNFERYLTRNGVVIRKFFLHVSKKEQKKQFLERIALIHHKEYIYEYGEDAPQISGWTRGEHKAASGAASSTESDNV